MSKILIEISAGELYDRITILQIKANNINNKMQLDNIHKELKYLLNKESLLHKNDTLLDLFKDLKKVNEQLWKIEDRIRECEKDKDFGDRFVELARSVYIFNDKRSFLKREISTLVGSRFIEEKSYTKYKKGGF